MRRGILIILSSPSGAGKSTLARRLRDWDPSIRFSVSATTRPPRPGEAEGREYYFRDPATFAAMIEAGEFLEHATVFGNRYGSLKAEVFGALEQGHDVLFDIDWQGGQQIRNSYQGMDAVSIFLLPPSIAALRERLRARAQDDAETIEARMARSRDEISHWPEYDYVLINEDLQKTEANLQAIVTAERLQRTRQVGIAEFVRGLNREFDAG